VDTPSFRVLLTFSVHNMSDSGKQSPLGANALCSLLQNSGLNINPVMAAHMGVSPSETGYVLGTMCNNTCLRLLTYAIHDAFVRGYASGADISVSKTVYDELIYIGAGMVPALGNSKPTTFNWSGPADAGDSTSLAAQVRSWIPYTSANPYPEITSWGYIRLLALQARHEFNYNSTYYSTSEYKDFLSSFMCSYAFVEYSNAAITAVQNSKTYLDGTYSNMNDLISADILGVNLSAKMFGLDLIDIGKAIDLSSIDSFGLPSKLLVSLQKYNAITPSLTLALLSSGLSQAEVNTILASGTPTVEQETKIYGAFTIIADQDLIDILVPLNCKIALNTLADLLNVKKMFPRSYSSMTVPVYNTTFSNANSKIYYPIYVGSALNPNLTSAPVMSAVGTIIPTSMPPEVTSVTNPVFTPQEPFIGFGSYLFTIIPTDIGIAAGAFSVSMLQIKNILSVPIEKFAQSVINLETINGLAVNGSSVPAHLPLIMPGSNLIALGSGPQGTYTMSNFFGCMSGLPYSVARIQEITAMVRDVPGEAAKSGGSSLYDIYKELYLAVTWERAIASVQYTTYEVESPPLTFTTWYHATGVTITDQGGGYGRAGASPPVITMTGGSATSTIGTDKTNVGTFGRVTALSFSSGADLLSPPTISIDFPPGTGSFSNSIVQGYIDLANAEIAAIRTKFPALSAELNTLWDATGTQLTREQRSRSIALPPVPVPKNTWLSSFPITHYSFVDSIPRYALNTNPHMYAQTLEAISNMSTVGGQSIVAMMRQERNQARLAPVGIPLDNNIPVMPPLTEQSSLLANGLDGGSIMSFMNQAVSATALIEVTADTTIDGGGIVDTITVTNPGSGYTEAPTVTIVPTGLGDGATATTILNSDGTIDVILDSGGSGYTEPPLVTFTGGVSTTLVSPSSSGTYDSVNNTYYITDPLFGSTGGSGNNISGQSHAVDTGGAVEPGSLSGSPYSNLIPPNLNTLYTSGILLPASQTPTEAIGEVTVNNCDCWTQP